ncbi:uncharacterized protein LOC134391953 [Elgaria multicarinata webbii]|uniref:uncharacterized protein LOC134391953 n=1 Tax=Elgaria multicarinata webbii TaxID=159646 RepID=UPI002FCD584E
MAITSQDNLLSVPPSSRSCSLSALCKNSSVQQCEETVRPSSDSMVSSSGHVTKRKKRRTDLSAGFGGNSTMGLSDNVPLDGLQWAKEAEPAATKSLDISQVGELVTLSTKNKSYAKIKANETKALKRVSAGKKDRDSSISQSKRNVDNYSNVRVDTAILSETNELSNSKINIPKPACPAEDSSRMDSLEEMVPLGSYGWKANYSSQHSDKTTGCTTSSWIDPAPPNHVNGCNALTQEVKKRTFLGKMKNLGSQFQNPETSSLSNKVQQDEKSHGYDVKRMSQCSNKAKDCRRTYVVDPGPPDDENDCALFIHESKKKTHLDNFEDLGSWFQSPKSSSLNNKAPLSTISTQQLFGFQTQIPSQEATLGLNIKRKKPKRRTQEIDVPSRFGEIEVQSVDINMNSQIQESKSDMQGSKTKKGYKGETAKAGRDNTQREHCRTDVEVFDLSENAPRVNKRKNKTSKVSLKSTSQANTISPASQGSTLSTFPVLLVDEATSVDSVHRNSAKMSPKVQGSSTTQNSSSSNKTNSSSSQKAYWGVDNNVIGLKERVDSTAKLKKRTYTVKYVTEECVPSGVALQSPAECKTSQIDQAGWNFLRAPSSRTLRDSLIMDVTEVPPPLFDSLAICTNAPDSSSVGHSKIMLSSCQSFGHSCSMLPAAKDQGSTERFSALPKILTVSKKDDAKPLASTRQEKKTVQATPETLPKENENKVLKDLTNASPSSCHSIPLEVSPTRPSRRRNKEVCYAEPKINRKLRRGDPFTVTDFLSSPIYKTKSKKLTKGSGKSRKTKKMKEEDV